MKILTINAGSSSMKFSVMEIPNGDEIISGGFERIGLDGSFYKIKYNGEKITREREVSNHLVALEMIKEELLGLKVVNSLDEIDAIGHRVVHGGESFNKSVIIDDKVCDAIIKCSKLAPLHNPANLACIKASQEAFKGKVNVAVFDTSFHQSMKPTNYLYPVPYSWYKDYGVRKYGFHGTSHRFINREISSYLKRDDLKVISCHIGSGASVCAIDSGNVVDTSMGFSPMTGVMMGTRPGDIDPTILTFMSEEANMTIDEVVTKLNKESGLLGICGKSDSRDVENGIESNDEMCILAQDMMTQRIANYIAVYNNELNGADVICFTAGLGERSIITRKDVVDKLASLGVKLDKDLNNIQAEFALISSDDSKIPVYVVPTNEELMIALDTYDLVK